MKRSCKRPLPPCQNSNVSRPLASRLGAWSSPQSQVITSRQILEAKLDQMKRKFADGEVPLPDHWGGYRIVPETFEFWQGGSGRLHDRFIYRLDAALCMHRKEETSG